jgi:hypothetical protein
MKPLHGLASGNLDQYLTGTELAPSDSLLTVPRFARISLARFGMSRSLADGLK